MSKLKNYIGAFSFDEVITHKISHSQLSCAPGFSCYQYPQLNEKITNACTTSNMNQKYPVITERDFIFQNGKGKEMVELPGFISGISIGEIGDIIKCL